MQGNSGFWVPGPGRVKIRGRTIQVLRSMYFLSDASAQCLVRSDLPKICDDQSSAFFFPQYVCATKGITVIKRPCRVLCQPQSTPRMNDKMTGFLVTVQVYPGLGITIFACYWKWPTVYSLRTTGKSPGACPNFEAGVGYHSFTHWMNFSGGWKANKKKLHTDPVLLVMLSQQLVILAITIVNQQNSIYIGFNKFLKTEKDNYYMIQLIPNT